MSTPEIALTESRAMRAETAGRVDVLDKVKALALLPDGTHATTEGVASYFEAGVDAIESIVRRHREELTENGMRTLRGDALREFETANLTASSGSHNRRALRVFSRRAILNVGQLLTESDVARRVRTYLLDVEGQATPAQRLDGVERARLAQERLSAMGVAKQFGLVNSSYVEAMARTELARMNGEEPDIDPADVTITCDEFLTEQGVSGKQLRSARVKLGQTVATLYRARYGQPPQKIKRPINGVHRDVAVYTHRDIDLFDKAWAELGRHYNVQTAIGGAA
jgi:hypothetical protein